MIPVPGQLELHSEGNKRDKLKWTNAQDSQFFADFRRFLLIFRFSWELQHFGGADFRRKPQETADFRRKPQETADFRRNPFVPFSLSLLVPPYTWQMQTWCLAVSMLWHSLFVADLILGMKELELHYRC